MRGNLTRVIITTMHTHFGALTIGGAFLGVLLAGTLWKLGATHLAGSDNAMLRNLGGAALYQYN